MSVVGRNVAYRQISFARIGDGQLQGFRSANHHVDKTEGAWKLNVFQADAHRPPGIGHRSQPGIVCRKKCGHGIFCCLFDLHKGRT